MKFGIIGLGKMGRAIAYRARKAGHQIIGYDIDPKTCAKAHVMGVEVAENLADVSKSARIVWLMVPHTQVDVVIEQMLPYLSAGAIIIDGGNSYYKDSIRRAAKLAVKNIVLLDCGTSGGVLGKRRGFCLMIGGDPASYNEVLPLLTALAASGSVAHVGPSGAGHYVKMIHNGIEYGLLQAYAEGFHVLKEGAFRTVPLNLEHISQIWNKASIIRSFLLGLAHNIFTRDQEFRDIVGEIEEGGTGRWALHEAGEHHIEVPVLKQACEVRDWSRKKGGNYTTKFIALMRKEFGGHTVKKRKSAS